MSVMRMCSGCGETYTAVAAHPPPYRCADCARSPSLLAGERDIAAGEHEAIAQRCRVCDSTDSVHKGFCSRCDPANSPRVDVVTPAHYGAVDDPYRPRRVAEAWAPSWVELGRPMLVFYLANVLKYLGRVARKGSPLDDLRKARGYLDLAINDIDRT